MADITLISGSTSAVPNMWQNTWLKSWKRRVLPPKRCTVRCWKIYLPRGSGWLSAQPTVPEIFRTTFLLSMKHCRNRSPIFLRSALAQSVLVVVNMTPFCGAIDKLEAELKNSGAKQTGETLKINILDHDIPEDPAEEWLGSWINLLK